MMRCRSWVWVLLLGVALLAALTSAAGVSITRAASLCVNPGGTDGCSSTIQAAVDAANAGDTVTVAAGTYAEMVTVTKPITLQGAGAAATIIDATGLDHAIFVNGVSGPATISGFTAENATYAGILLRDSSALTLANNTIQDNDKGLVPSAAPGGMGTCPGAPPNDGADCGEGLHLQGLSDSLITNNLITGSQGGMLVTDETGPTHDNVISGNMIENNAADCGITLASHEAGLTPPQGPPSPGGGVYDNIIADNISSGNGSAGVGIFDTVPGTADYGNLIIGNTLMNNGLPGVTMHLHSGGQNLDNNVIEGNLISGNGPDMPQGVPTGITIFANAAGSADPITGTIIAGNQISGQVDAIFVGTNATNVSVHNNDLSGNAVGVENGGTGTVDANWNYWGCSDGPGASGCAGVKGTVAAAAWLASAPPPAVSMP